MQTDVEREAKDAAERFARSAGKAVLWHQDIPVGHRWGNGLGLSVMASCFGYGSGNAFADVDRCHRYIDGFRLYFALTGDPQSQRWTEATVTVTFPPPPLPDISSYVAEGLARRSLATPSPMRFKARLDGTSIVVERLPDE